MKPTPFKPDQEVLVTREGRYGQGDPHRVPWGWLILAAALTGAVVTLVTFLPVLAYLGR